MLDEGIRRRDADRRERMFGEEALWHYKRGVARARLGRAELARDRTFRSRWRAKRATGCAAAPTPSSASSPARPATGNRRGASIVLP